MNILNCCWFFCLLFVHVDKIVRLFPQVEDRVAVNRALSHHMMSHFRGNHSAPRDQLLQKLNELNVAAGGASDDTPSAVCTVWAFNTI